ncbi:Uncharacterized protein HSRCO_1632 [Halanaeroarchaeum sp. HSR-CO]|nr:Uncharacterized protein HSRCO_1632 [Halanaeroarchaeum sp. HSR-CO]
MSPVNEAVSGIGLSPLHEVLLIAAFLGLVLVGVASVLSHLYDAEDRVEAEMREVVAERNAYRAFAEAIDSIPVVQPAGAVATPQSIQTMETRAAPVDHVRRAFEETVMAVDHYDDTYGETWETHLVNEFDADFLGGLREGSGVNRPMKRALQQRALDAASRRDELIQVLSTEQAAVEDATATLDEIETSLSSMDDGSLDERSFEELMETYAALETLEDRTVRLARRRQRQIHNETRCGRWDTSDLTLQEYLYGPLSMTYPVLHTTTRLTDDLGTARHSVVETMTARV